MSIGTWSSLLGLSSLAIRLLPLTLQDRFRNRLVRDSESSDYDLVSIIIPARNEALNLPRLLSSLTQCSWPRLEVIVIDDESTDGTWEVASGFEKDFLASGGDRTLKVVKGQPRPEYWTGKNWACHQGYRCSSGKYVLFTDADTEHLEHGVDHAVSRMREKGIDLLTAVPFHRCETWWERLIGPFHLLLLIGSSAFSRPRPGRVFAIGQFLLFHRAWYEHQGGHEAIKGSLCDDLELARICLERSGRYEVELSQPLYRVRMYRSYLEFVSGWRRIVRLGFRHASLWSSIEMYFVVAVLTANMRFFAASIAEQLLALIALSLVAVVQRRFGEFSILGVLLLPMSLALFIVISCLALFDVIFGRAYSWRGRTYLGSARKSG